MAHPKSDSPPPLPPTFIQMLATAVGSANLLTEPAACIAYSWDNTGMPFLPQIVVLATTPQHVIATLQLCHRHGIPVTPRGAGTGNVGGALPVRGGVILSTQRLNRILEISVADRLAVVEPGVINQELQQQLQPYGLFWPPDPSSARSCTIGGNIAMCAAGPMAIRHGVTRDWVLGLEAVLPDGRILRTGGRTTKGVVGYDMTRLLIGSEGTLAVTTRATLKLAPILAASRLIRAIFASTVVAAQGVAALMAAGDPPCAIEFLDAAALALLRSHHQADLPENGQAMLLVEMCGSAADIATQTDSAEALLQSYHPLEIRQAKTEDEANLLRAARSALAPTLKKLAPRRINEDVVVPVSRLAELLDGLQELSRQSGVAIVNFGHAGNGNIHVNLLIDPNNPEDTNKVKPLLDAIFRLVLQLDGSLSGEHGVGIQKMAYIGWELDKVSLELQQGIKRLFDPKGVLNPGKVFPRY